MNWRRWLKPLIMFLYAIIICVGIPFIVKEFNNKHASTRKEAWLIGGIFTMGAVPISLWTIIEHVINYTKPYLQRHIIRVLWMVPIYALNAWLALGFPQLSIYFDTLRECYEAYVIYNFMAFLLNFLKHEYPDFGYMIEQKSQVKHLVPCCCLPKWTMGRKFINACRHGVLQYTFVRPFATVVAFICEMAGVYHANEFRIDGAYVYLNVVTNISQIWAMYSLIMFYRCTRVELKPLKPVSKFICVKFVVFLSFWQAVLFSILTATKVISSIESWKVYKPQDVSSIFQNFCITIEMFIAAIAHHFSFSVGPYRLEYSEESPRCCYSCLAMCDLSDVKKDMIEHVKHVGKGVKSRLIPSNSGNINNFRRHNEETPLINKCDSDSDLSRFSDSESHPSQSKIDRKYPDRLESIDSIGSGSSLKEDVHITKVMVIGSRSSLNNQLLTSQSSTTPLFPVVECREESSNSFINFSSFNQSSFDDKKQSQKKA